MTYLWVATAFMESTFPRVERFELVEQTKRGWRVKFHGSSKIICKALERHFFTEEAALEKWLRGWVEQRLDNCRRLCGRYEDALTKPLAGCYAEQVAGESPPWADRELRL